MVDLSLIIIWLICGGSRTSTSNRHSLRHISRSISLQIPTLFLIIKLERVVLVLFVAYRSSCADELVMEFRRLILRCLRLRSIALIEGDLRVWGLFVSRLVGVTLRLRLHHYKLLLFSPRLLSSISYTITWLITTGFVFYWIISWFKFVLYLGRLHLNLLINYLP